MEGEAARAELVVALQLAYSGELGAARAYLGHRHALARSGYEADRRLVSRILRDEVEHRRVLRRMLEALGAAPDPRRERKLDRIGRAIACFCQVGGWFLPMYGAARLERDNIVEYEIAAQLALRAGHEELVDELLELAEVEWDHERALRERAATHRLWGVLPRWAPPPPRATIRERFEAFRRRPDARPRRPHNLVR